MTFFASVSGALVSLDSIRDAQAGGNPAAEFSAETKHRRNFFIVRFQTSPQQLP